MGRGYCPECRHYEKNATPRDGEWTGECARLRRLGQLTGVREEASCLDFARPETWTTAGRRLLNLAVQPVAEAAGHDPAIIDK